MMQGKHDMILNRLINLTREIVYGRYRFTGAPVHGGPANPPGGGAGAGSFPGSLVTVGAEPGSNPFADTGIRAGEVKAYRCWRWNSEHKRLYSVYMQQFCWAPHVPAEGEPTAEGCGIHAFKNPDLCMDYTADQGIANLIFGYVDLWGDVYEHERGYRASRAAITGLACGFGLSDISDIREIYGVGSGELVPPERSEGG